MKKRYLIALVFAATIPVIFFLLCSQPTKPLIKPRLAPVADMSVFADDTIRLSVNPVIAPDTISGYIWSFRGENKIIDTTKTNTILRSWGPAEAGICTIAVKIFDGRGMVSDSVVFRVTVSVCKPSLKIIADTVVDFNEPCQLSMLTSSSCKHLGPFLWSFNGGKSFSDTSLDTKITKRWNRSDTGKIVKVAAIAQVAQGQFSDPALLNIHVVCCRPSILIKADSVVYVGETTHFSITNNTNCPILNYLWTFNRGNIFTDTTFNPSILRQWQVQDTGTRLVLAAAQTTAGIISPVDTFLIRVSTGQLRVSLPQDTVCAANDTLTIAAHLVLAHSALSNCTWSIDQSPQTIMTKTATLSYCFSSAQVGAHTITVRAVDEQGQFAVSNALILTVGLTKPMVSVPNDTLVRAKDTVNAAVGASSPAGAIVKYLWNVGSLSWTDSSDSPRRKIWRQGKDTVAVLVGARDQHGNLGIDSFHVFFNAPPENLTMLSPRNDTVCFRSIDGSLTRGEVPFSFSASDRNGASDSLMYRLSLGKSSTSLSKVYEGRLASYTVARLDTALYFWSLVVRDRLGDSAVIAGSFTCILQRTICFAGHSIIVGLGCDRESDGTGGTGGIRKKVLSALRVKAQNPTKIKSIGPLPTGFLTDKKDDSCLAVSSYRAKDVLLLMRNNFPTLTADMWVVMLGVNDRYSIGELQNIMTIVDLIYANNPLSYTYVINGLPFQQAYGQDSVFNKWLVDSVQAKKTLNTNRKIYAIDAYKKFAVNGAPNPDLFIPNEVPYLHPNQRGYDSLAQMVLDTMTYYKQP
jgi:hypothetical protein